MSLEYARTVLQAEIAAIESVISKLGSSFGAAVDEILKEERTRVITSGIGKAGIIAQKVAATLASTGTESLFLHPSDALHGDLGVTRSSDVALIFSNSGESDEISALLPFLRRLGLTVIAVTGSDRSTLAVQADLVLEMGNLEEACPLGLAPTASTTAMLALGDALAMALMQRRDFSVSDYAKYHPAGELGRKTFTVAEIMRGCDSVALAGPDEPVDEVLHRIDEARAGAAIITDAQGKLLGIFTDGDLRRGLLTDKMLLTKPVMHVMVHHPRSCRDSSPAQEALVLMREHRIGELPVLDSEECVVGMVDLKGILAAGIQ
jgi:arabinose-5-phosphate isomerase